MNEPKRRRAHQLYTAGLAMNESKQRRAHQLSRAGLVVNEYRTTQGALAVRRAGGERHLLSDARRIHCTGGFPFLAVFTGGCCVAGSQSGWQHWARWHLGKMASELGRGSPKGGISATRLNFLQAASLEFRGMKTRFCPTSPLQEPNFGSAGRAERRGFVRHLG